MKTPVCTLLLAAALLSAGCKEPPRGETTAPAQKPVVNVAPVLTKPFEAGYDAGYELGKQQATPKARIPEPEDVERLAREQSEGHADRTERWQRGFVSGYTDGFRNVVTGKK